MTPSARRLPTVNASSPLLPAATAAATTSHSLPLSRLLAHTADAVAAVRAGRSLTEALAACPAAARPGTQALSFHAMRWMGGAEAACARLAPRTPPPRVHALLITALALLWPEADAPYPEHTLVDQAVACAHQTAPKSASFVNAVLRRFLREQAALVADLQATQPAARHQHPRWWIDQLQCDWPQQWAALLTAANQAAPMVLRVHAGHGDAAAYVVELAAAGLRATAVGAHAVVLDQPVPVQALPGFEAGRVSVQDLSAQHAAPLLLGQNADALPQGARVLDACAAPGGKTAHLLELRPDLQLLALDSDAQRLQRVTQTLARLHLDGARTQAADARDTAAWWDGQPFDAILLDAPCSASGIVRRHPDVRWLRRASDIGDLARTQRALLDTLWPLVRPGGRLVYATCSVFRAEGAGQISAFLQRHADARTGPAPGHLLPLTDNSVPAGDGFFYARLDKPVRPT
ncbi:MAG: 16S rRNA (cytosine(967)-C(5))-methyltransferase RsmB [Sphaerotilus sp.]|nr:16S rRNA (cytosine(967)-C(5))-methyltransferase RsmB [Sphaerotilus sp.]